MVEVRKIKSKNKIQKKSPEEWEKEIMYLLFTKLSLRHKDLLAEGYTRATLSKYLNSLFKKDFIIKVSRYTRDQRKYQRKYSRSKNEAMYYELTNAGIKELKKYYPIKLSFLNILEQNEDYYKKYKFIFEFYREFDIDLRLIPELIDSYSRWSADSEFTYKEDLLVAIFFLINNEMSKHNVYLSEQELFKKFKINQKSERAKRTIYYISHIVRTNNIKPIELWEALNHNFKTGKKIIRYLDPDGMIGKFIRQISEKAIYQRKILEEFTEEYFDLMDVKHDVLQLIDHHKLFHSKWLHYTYSTIEKFILNILEREGIKVTKFGLNVEKAKMILKAIISGVNLTIESLSKDLDKIVTLTLKDEETIIKSLNKKQKNENDEKDEDSVINEMRFQKRINLLERSRLLERSQRIENLLHLGLLYYYKRDYTNALDTLDKLELLISDEPTHIKKKVYYFKAKIYFDTENFLKSVEYCGRSLKLDDDYVYPMDLLAKIYDNTDDYAKCVEVLLTQLNYEDYYDPWPPGRPSLP